MTQTTALYVRQSLDKTGKEAAVERQEASCRDFATAKDWTVGRVYRDNSISASNGKVRPDFEQLLADIDAGTVQNVIVWHLDRLTRSMKDLTRVIEAGQARRVNIACVHGTSLDLGDPTGVAVATILTAIAAMEVQHKGNRQKAANHQRARNGHAHWIRRPFGYERTGDVVRVVPAEAAALREAADKVLAGATLTSIANDLNTAGHLSTAGKPWNVTSLRRALINPRTAGRRLYNGEDMGAGIWEPIFSVETHAALEQRLTDPRRKTAPDDLNSKYLLSGIAVCGKCGNKMFAAPVKSGGKQWMVYRCFGGYCMTRRLDLVDDVVEAVVVGVLSRPDAAALFTNEGDSADVRRKAADLRERRDALAALLADGLLSPAAVREQSGRITTELAALEGRLTAADSLNPAAAVAQAGDVAAAWSALPLGGKRKAIRALMDVTVLPAGKGVRFKPEQVHIEWKGQES
ncbi:recombinase family protein [Arthrobacter cheniae]|uniref:Recombinase family protein n=1 Tax=Arthrobacter cheniae TaxID=1258888 RepID=A0A3A5M9K8_9MICC|nr:recombinase family protein [Arthrobacter cheniae]RJT82203.1 recombinase family protein [Arthrobacter cheniae]